MMFKIFSSLLLISMAFACAPTEKDCNGACYNPGTTVCLTDFNGQKALCPTGHNVCNKACYLPSLYNCQNGQLQSGPSANNGNNNANNGNNGNANTGNNNANSGNTNQPSSPSCPRGSECPNNLCSCDGVCYTEGTYTCPKDSVLNKNIVCRGTQSACNGQCFDASAKQCTNGAVVDKSTANTGNSGNNGNSGAKSTEPASGGGAPVKVNPSPVASQFPAQTADLRIINNCKETLWFEGRYGGQGAPIPGQSNTATRALPGSYVDYTVPATGLSGTRFWAKYGCDANGRNCLIGDQMQYWPNPPGGCPTGGCTPPVDSLFEATWGCKPGAACNAQNPTTWFDTSQVDGWTIPYKLTTVGDTSKCDCNGPKCGFNGVDASRLALERCPTGEDVSNGGQFGSINVGGKVLNLNNIDLRIINNGKVLGCMSPCKKLNWSPPYGLGQSEDKGATMWMCCPTPEPNNCSPARGCITPLACRNGPIEKTKFVAAVHDMAPGVYSYSYDDGVGLHACPAGVTKYTMEFCPTGSANYPGKA